MKNRKAKPRDQANMQTRNGHKMNRAGILQAPPTVRRNIRPIAEQQRQQKAAILKRHLSIITIGAGGQTAK